MIICMWICIYIYVYLSVLIHPYTKPELLPWACHEILFSGDKQHVLTHTLQSAWSFLRWLNWTRPKSNPNRSTMSIASVYLFAWYWHSSLRIPSNTLHKHIDLLRIYVYYMHVYFLLLVDNGGFIAKVLVAGVHHFGENHLLQSPKQHANYLWGARRLSLQHLE